MNLIGHQNTYLEKMHAQYSRSQHSVCSPEGQVWSRICGLGKMIENDGSQSIMGSKNM